MTFSTFVSTIAIIVLKMPLNSCQSVNQSFTISSHQLVTFSCTAQPLWRLVQITSPALSAFCSYSSYCCNSRSHCVRCDAARQRQRCVCVCVVPVSLKRASAFADDCAGQTRTRRRRRRRGHAPAAAASSAAPTLSTHAQRRFQVTALLSLRLLMRDT